MSKVDEYTGNGMIVVSDGEVWAVDDSGLPDVIGEIGRVELSIEMPENLIGIYRVEHIMLFDEDDEISFDAEEEEETPEETAEEVLEDMAHEEDAEDEVKWAEKVICNFGVYAGTPLGEMMQDARGYQTIKWLVQRYKGQNQEIQKAAKILLDHEKEMQKAA